MPYRHPVTGDSVLTRRETAIRTAHWSAYAPPSAALAAQLKSLPTIQHLALMQMHESQVSRTVVAHLRGEVQGPPSSHDYVALRQRGWCIRRPADRWHSLTGDGVTAAAHLEQMLCRRFGLHLMIEAGDDRFHVRFRCCCGDWQTQSRKGDFTESNARSAFNRHVEESAGLKRLYGALGSAAEG